MSVTLRKRKIKSGGYSLYLDIYSEGNRQREFLKIYLGKNREVNKENIKTAESYRAKREIEINSGNYGFVPGFKKNANFILYFENLTKSKPKGTNKSYQNTLNYLQSFTKGSVKFTNVNDDWLKKFIKYLETQKLARNSIVEYLNVLKASLNEAIRDKIILVNPFQFIKMPKREEVEKSFLTLEELKLLASTKCRNNEVKKAFLFSCFTGLRLSDVRNLEWRNIKENSIEFRQKKTKGFEYMPLSKNALSLLFPSGKKIINLNQGKVFNLPKPSGIRYHLIPWCKEAKLKKKVTYHTSRHTFATLMLTQGADLYTVSKLLGHSEISTTQIYAKIIDSKKQEAVNSLPTIDVSL